MCLQEGAGAADNGLASAESVSCHGDGMEVEFSRELGNSSWHVCVVGRCCCPGPLQPCCSCPAAVLICSALLDPSGEELVSCNHTVDHERLLLTALFANCTVLEVKRLFWEAALGECVVVFS